MHPTMIIGLGTSGLEILEHLQNFLYITYRDRMQALTPAEKVNILTALGKPPKVELFDTLTDREVILSMMDQDGVVLINIETDPNRKPKGTPVGPLFKPQNVITATATDITAAVANLRERNIPVKWVPDNLENILTANAALGGAGNLRAAGRLAFWKLEQFDAIAHRIQAEWIPLPGKLDTHRDRVDVIITGTLIGGTCSGMFLDLAYLARHYSFDQGNYIGLFLVPPQHLGFPRREANCWAALEDLEYFTDPNSTYDYLWPNGTRSVSNSPPFHSIYLVSTQYEQTYGYKKLTLPELYYLCGCYLFSHVAGMRSVIAQARINVGHSGSGIPVASFGIAGLSYPRNLLSEYVACEMALKFIEKLTNPQYYADSQGQTRPLEKNTIYSEAENFLEKVVFSQVGLFEDLNPKGSFQKVVEEATDQWKKGTQLLNILEDFQYDENNNVNSFGLLRSKETAIRDNILKAVNEELANKLFQIENLEYLKYYLEGLNQGREKLLKLWQGQNVGPNTQDLNTAVLNVANRLVKFNWWEPDRSKRLEASLRWAAEKGTLHVLYKALLALELDPATTMNAPGHIQRVSPDLSIPLLAAMGGGLTQGDGSALANITRRKQELLTLLRTEGLPIQVVMGGAELHAFLHKLGESLPQVSYRFLKRAEPLGTFLRPFATPGNTQWLELVGACQAVTDAKVAELGAAFTLDKAIEAVSISEVSEPAKHILLPMAIRGTVFGGTNPGVPSIKVHADPALLAKVEKAIPGEFPHDCSREEFQHTLLFYREQLHLNPMEHLAHANVLKNSRATPEGTFPPALWEALMDPYEVHKKKLSPLARKVAEVTTYLVAEWMRNPRGEFVVTGSRHPHLHLGLSGGELTLQLEQQHLRVDFSSHQTLRQNLTEALLNDLVFLQDLAKLLRPWQPTAEMFSAARPRWEQMGFSDNEINDMENNFKQLNIFLQ